MTTNNAINLFPSGRNLAIATDLSSNPWQRGESFVSIANADVADMFSFFSVGSGRVTITKDADAPTVTQAGVFTSHSLACAVTTTDPLPGINQRYSIFHGMEGYDWAKLAQRTITASFWVKCNLTGTFCISLVNSGSDRSFVQEYTINSSNTWEKKVIRIPPSPSAGTWNYTNGLGIYFRWSLDSGTNFQTTPGTWQSVNADCTSNQTNFMATVANTFKIALLQIEPGFTATPYEFVPEETVFKRCQRYYYKTYNNSVLPGTSTTAGATTNFSVTSSGLLPSNLALPKTSMRTTPSITIYSTTGASGFVRNLTAGADEPILGFATSTESSLGYPVFNATVSVDDNQYAAHQTASAAL